MADKVRFVPVLLLAVEVLIEVVYMPIDIWRTDIAASEASTVFAKVMFTLFTPVFALPLIVTARAFWRRTKFTTGERICVFYVAVVNFGLMLLAIASALSTDTAFPNMLIAFLLGFLALSVAWLGLRRQDDSLEPSVQ